jgi:exonuclease SbcC
MRIEKVEAIAFGPFSGDSLELAPGMTVVWGPNEAGKSSWHAAIYAGLCGRRRVKGSPAKADKEFMARHKPWHSDKWQVRTVVKCDGEKGRRLEFFNELIKNVGCSVVDTATGEDVSGDFINDGAPDGSRLLGLTRETIPMVLSVRQSEILAVLNDPDNLQESIQKAAATGKADATAQQAITTLETFKSDRIGSAISTSKKPLRLAINGVDSAREELRQAEEAHSDLELLVRKRNEQRGLADGTEHRLRQAKATELLPKISDLEKRMGTHKELEPEFKKGGPPEKDPWQEKQKNINKTLIEWAACPEKPEPPEHPLAEELRLSARNLPNVIPPGDREEDPQVQDLRDKWFKAKTAYDAQQDTESEVQSSALPTGISPARVRYLADKIELGTKNGEQEPVTQVPEQAIERRNERKIILPLTVSLSGIALGALAWILGNEEVGIGISAVLLVLAFAIFMKRDTGSDDEHRRNEFKMMAEEARKSQEKADFQSAKKALEDYKLPSDPDELRTIATNTENLKVAQNKHQDWQNDLDKLSEEKDKREEALRSLLQEKDVGLPDSGDLDDACAKYKVACKKRREVAQKVTTHFDLTKQAEQKETEENKYKDLMQVRKDAIAALRKSASQLNIEDDEPGVVVEALERLQSEAADQAEEWNKTCVRWNDFQNILEGDTIKGAELRLKQLRAEFEKLPKPDKEIDPVATPIEQLEKEAKEAQNSYQLLAGQVQERERNNPNVSEAEEQLDASEKKLKRLEKLTRLTDEAKRFLEAARDSVQKDIAPKLKAAIEDWLPNIVGDRYKDVGVNPATLKITLRDGSGSYRDASRLSHGTSEQIYFLLRIALAEHLVTTDEKAPLILDDVTVQSDHERTLRLLDLLHSLSHTRQIILFSQENAVKTWAKEHLDLAGERDKVIPLKPIVA